MDNEAGSNLQLETELSTQAHNNDNEHQQMQRNSADEDSQEDSPGKTFKESVSELLVFSGQSVKAMVSANVSIPVTAEWTDEENTSPPISSERGIQTEQSAHKDEVNNTADTKEEKTVLQSLGESIAETTQSIMDAVNATSDYISADSNEEKSLLQSAGERIVQSAQSVKDAIHDRVSNEDGEERTLLQAVSDKIVQSAQSVKDSVSGTEMFASEEDETATASILVHTAID